MTNISKHITYDEATRSVTAIKFGLKNDPNAEQLCNMRLLADNVFEKVREHFGKPIYINSFFRSPEVNKKVHGASNSQHVTGQAIDLDDTYNNGLTNKDIFNYIRKNLDFDQLIWEFGTNSNPAWVHVSYNRLGNRKQVLKSKVKNGKTIYSPF